MSFETRLIALAQAVGGDVKTLTLAVGSLPSLNTTAKSNLVAAINEIQAALAGSGAQIDDTATNGATGVTWSVDKIYDEIALARQSAIDAVTNGAGSTLDTLNELAAALDNDPSFATTIATGLANRVRFDAAQTLTAPQQTQARSNIDAASATELATLTTNVGDTDVNLVTVYNTAKA